MKTSSHSYLRIAIVFPLPAYLRRNYAPENASRFSFVSLSPSLRLISIYSSPVLPISIIVPRRERNAIWGGHEKVPFQSPSILSHRQHGPRNTKQQATTRLAPRKHVPALIAQEVLREQLEQGC